MTDGQNTLSSSYEQTLKKRITWNSCLLSRYYNTVNFKNHICTAVSPTWTLPWARVMMSMLSPFCLYSRMQALYLDVRMNSRSLLSPWTNEKKTPKSWKTKHAEACFQFNETGSLQQATEVSRLTDLLVYESTIQSTAAILLGLLSFLLAKIYNNH